MQFIYGIYKPNGPIQLYEFIIFFGIVMLVMSQLPSFHSLRYINLLSLLCCLGYSLCLVGASIYTGGIPFFPFLHKIHLVHMSSSLPVMFYRWILETFPMCLYCLNLLMNSQRMAKFLGLLPAISRSSADPSSGLDLTQHMKMVTFYKSDLHFVAPYVRYPLLKV